VKPETVILGVGGAALAYYFWKHPQGLPKSGATATANGRSGTPGAPVIPIVGGRPADGSTLGAASLTGLGLTLLKLFSGNSPQQAPASSSSTQPHTSSPLEEVPSYPLDASAQAAADAGSIASNQGIDYNPGPAIPDPSAADNSIDFGSGNSIDALEFA
jgi:hypothetical protein